MRRWWAIVRATALEMSSEPLALLLTISAVAAVMVASAFHIHQFGEPSRMARDAGLSALLVVGLAYSVFCTIKVFRREIESGTLQMALAHPVSRAGFFLSKATGAFLAYLVFALTVFGVVATTVAGAEVGGQIAAPTGDVSRVWGPSIAFDAAVIVVPLFVAAVLNRFARFRFTTTVTWTALAVSLIGAVANFALATGLGFDSSAVAAAMRVAPAAVMLVMPAAVFVVAAAAFSVRFRDNAASSLCGLLFLAVLPAFGNYYLSDALSKGGSLPWTHVALAFAVTAPTVAGFALLGVHMFGERDVG